MRTTLELDVDTLGPSRRLASLQGRTADPFTATEAPPANGFRPFAAQGRSVTNAVIDALRDSTGS